jgi:hypothetical protein
MASTVEVHYNALEYFVVMILVILNARRCTASHFSNIGHYIYSP